MTKSMPLKFARVLLLIVIDTALAFSFSYERSSGGPSSQASEFRNSDTRLSICMMTPSNWKQVNLEQLSFCIPREMKRARSRNIDSAVWKFSSNTLDLTIDMGRYSGKPALYQKKPDYKEESIEIDGKKATLCTYRQSDPGSKGSQQVAAVYFSDIGKNGMQLSFMATFETETQQEIAKKIFLSIRFK